MGLYSRVFCTRGELDPARKRSPLVPSPVSCKGAPLYQLNTISLNLSQEEIYTLQYPAFPGCHLSERRVTGLSLVSWHLLRVRLSSVLLPRKLHVTGRLLVALLLWGHISSSQILCFVSHLLHIIPWAVVSDSWCDCSTLQINGLLIPILLCLALPSLIHFIRFAGAEIPKLTLPESTKPMSNYILGQRN